MTSSSRLATLYISACADPQTIETMRTYCFGSGMELTLLPEKDGRTDFAAVPLGADAACVYLQQPNYYGIIEDARAIGEAAHAAGAKFIMGCNPIALAIMETPAACGADIAVGEAQPLGLDLAFGGPYLGYMAANKAMFRKLPGRIVGQGRTPRRGPGAGRSSPARRRNSGPWTGRGLRPASCHPHP